MLSIRVKDKNETYKNSCILALIYFNLGASQEEDVKIKCSGREV
jgi:hypothetical protein